MMRIDLVRRFWLLPPLVLRESLEQIFPGTNTIKLFNDCSCYNVLANTPVQFPRMLQQALQHAQHRRGVAVIGLPGDLAAMEAIESVAATRSFPGTAVMRPSDTDLKEVADLINSSQKTTMFCGIGCRHAHDEVVALAEKIKAPVGYSFRGKMYVQHNNPCVDAWDLINSDFQKRV